MLVRGTLVHKPVLVGPLIVPEDSSKSWVFVSYWLKTSRGFPYSMCFLLLLLTQYKVYIHWVFLFFIFVEMEFNAV